MEAVAGTVFAVAKPALEQSYVTNPQQLMHIKNIGFGTSSIVRKSLKAGNTTAANVAGHTAMFGLEYGSVVFGAVFSFLSLCQILFSNKGSS